MTKQSVEVDRVESASIHEFEVARQDHLKGPRISGVSRSVLDMKVGSVLRIYHSTLVCNVGVGSGCSLTSLVGVAKKRGDGVWKVVHTAPHIALVYRTK